MSILLQIIPFNNRKIHRCFSADQYRNVVNEFGTQNQIDNFGDSSTNWQEQIYRMAYINENNVSVTGGIAGVPFRFSAGNKHEEGLLKRHQLDRYATSLNLSPKFLDNHLLFDINSRFVHTDNFFADQGAIWASNSIRPYKILLCLCIVEILLLEDTMKPYLPQLEVMQVILYL